jgi:quercetin dioxygenase-like cupin family protein
MNRTAILAAAAIIGVTAHNAALADEASEAAGVTWEELRRTTTNVVGDPITYPTGTSEIYIEIGTFEEDGRTPLHGHPVPVVVYVMEGELEVRVDGADPHRMKQGEASVEPQNRNMQAFNVANGPTKVLVVTMGAEGQPITVDPQ